MWKSVSTTSGFKQKHSIFHVAKSEYSKNVSIFATHHSQVKNLDADLVLFYANDIN